MKTIYRIYTERLDNDIAQAIMAQNFQAFTMIPTTGYWEGTREDSVVFEVLTDDGDLVHFVAEEIRAALNQDAVLVTCEAVVAKLISRRS